MAKIIDLEQARRTEEIMRFLIPKAVAGDDRKAMNAICDIPRALVDQMHLVYDARMRVIEARLRTRENRITLWILGLLDKHPDDDRGVLVKFPKIER